MSTSVTMLHDSVELRDGERLDQHGAAILERERGDELLICAGHGDQVLALLRKVLLDVLEHSEAIFVGQHQIEQNQAVEMAAEKFECFFLRYGLM